MRRFVDTSVLVAASIRSHVHHDRSLSVYRSLDLENDVCAAHTIAELYATLTRLPGAIRFRPEEAMLVIEGVCRRLRLVALDAEEYPRVVEEFAGQRLGGGQMYDALLLAAARKSGADTIYTWDVRRFRVIAPDLTEKIVEPT